MPTLLAVKKVDAGIFPEFKDNISDGRWITSRNVRFGYSQVSKSMVNGAKTAFPAVAGSPESIFVVKTATQEILYFCFNSKIYHVDAATGVITEIGQLGGVTTEFGVLAGSITPRSNWTMVSLGGLQIFCRPGFYPLKNTNLTSIALLNDVPGAPDCMMVLAGRLVIGSIRSVPLAGGGAPIWATETAMNRVYWSAPYAPESWTRDLSAKSGYADLIVNDRNTTRFDRPVEMVQNGEIGYIFTDNGIWVLAVAEHPRVFDLTFLGHGFKIFGQKTWCISDQQGSPMYVMGEDDFYMIIDRGILRMPLAIYSECFDQVNRNSRETAFAYYQQKTREVHFCVPVGTLANTKPTLDFCYNIDTKSWGILDCDYLATSLFGRSQNTGIHKGIHVDPADGLAKMFDVDKDNATPLASTVTAKFGLGYPGSRKILHSIIPRFTSTGTPTINVDIKSRRSAAHPLVSTPQKQFIVGTDRQIKSGARGEEFEITFSESGTVPWHLHEYTLDYSVEDID